MYCEKCGAKLEEGGNFCPKCGASLTQVSSEPSGASPGRKKKRSPVVIIIIIIIVGIVPIIGILSSIVLVSMSGAREAARDATRKADMRMIVTAQELYFGMNGAYYVSTNYPQKIGTYLAETPKDPGENAYTWVSNISNPQRFCVYATLEEGGYYTASYFGNFQCSDTTPTLDDCCY
jgi:Tfp pilus assembly protein PilE